MELAVASPPVKKTICRLIEQGENTNGRQRNTGASLLMCVIRAGFTDLVRLLIDKGVDIEAKSSEGETALMDAAYEGNIEVVQMLLEAGADPNRRSRSGWTAMDWAASREHEHILRTLMEAGGRYEGLLPLEDASPSYSPFDPIEVETGNEPPEYSPFSPIDEAEIDEEAQNSEYSPFTSTDDAANPDIG